jgi:ADP-ribose pyrophosphatase YjhB (NUDIX family)
VHDDVDVTGSTGTTYCIYCGTPLVRRFLPDEERDRDVCEACGHIHYVNPIVVAGTIPEQDGGIWLLRRAIEPRYGYWTFPAGFMEMGESVVDAAIRETREELDLVIEIGPLLGVYSRATMTNVHIVFAATALSEPRGGKETLEFRLFRPDEIPWDDLAFWSTEQGLRDWNDRRQLR